MAPFLRHTASNRTLCPRRADRLRLAGAPYCRHSLDALQTKFHPETVTCNQCGNPVELPGLDLGTVSVRAPAKRPGAKPRKKITAGRGTLIGAAVAVVVAAAGVYFCVSSPTFALDPVKRVIVRDLLDRANDPSGLEIVSWSEPKRYVLDETGRPAVQYDVRFRARNMLGGLVLCRERVVVSDGEVVRSVSLD